MKVLSTLNFGKYLTTDHTKYFLQFTDEETRLYHIIVRAKVCKILCNTHPVASKNFFSSLECLSLHWGSTFPMIITNI